INVMKKLHFDVRSKVYEDYIPERVSLIFETDFSELKRYFARPAKNDYYSRCLKTVIFALMDSYKRIMNCSCDSQNTCCLHGILLRILDILCPPEIC
ncbi:MAG: hypothetical protein QMD85_03375, partial [Candidatus Aenigmarchaeota archaeon]|nr:hypothetical protein [Candidatus Aenigmarchaeota archaeon]MDI6722584.1 hypothetical protein [Candidatus Aenigmarchaeota archaeon]